MARLRLLNTGKWNMPPVLTAARRLLIDHLARHAANKPLGEMADFVNGTSYRGDLLTDDGTPIIRISNISDPKSTFLATRQFFEDSYKVDIGDLLVSWSASFKSILWPGPPGILNQHIFRVRQRAGNDRSYIRHAIEAVFDEMQQKVVGIGMMHLRRQDFLGYKVPCPTYETQRAVSGYLDWIESGSNGKQPLLPDFLDEQRRIVSRLEELAIKIREARSLRHESVKEVQALLVSGWREAFEEEGSNAWQTSTLEECCEAMIDYRGRTPPITDAGIPHLTSRNIKNGAIDWKTSRYVTDETYERYMTRGLPRPGDVIFTMEAPLGEAAVVPDDRRFSLAQRTLLLRGRRDVLSGEFLAKALMSPQVRENIYSRATGTTVKGIASKRLRHIQLPIPPIAEQHQIVAYLGNLQAKLDSVKKLQSETAHELDALMPSILSRAFRGEL